MGGTGGVLGHCLEFWGEWVCFVKQMICPNEHACLLSCKYVCWVVDHCCWLLGAWLVIFSVGIVIWVLTVVQVDGLRAVAVGIVLAWAVVTW